MAEVAIRPLLAHDPEVTPPASLERWWLLLLPVFMAVVGILIATATTTSGQNQRRQVEMLEKYKSTLYWENELMQARQHQEGPEKIAELEKQVKEWREKPLSPFAEEGRHFTGWDGNRYEEILTEGYVYHLPSDPDDAKKDRMVMRAGWEEPRLKDVSWFPLFPALGWIVMKLLHVSPTAALTIVAEGSIVLASVLLFLYARRHYYNRMPKLQIAGAESHPSRRWDLRPEDSAAAWAVAALLYGPCSVFLYANFTESLFVLLLVAFLYCLQGRWWWRAAVIAALASACRSQGSLFAPTLAVVFLLRSDVRNPMLKIGIAAALGMVSAIGLGCYMVYLQIVFGDPLAFAHAQTYWNVGLNAASIFHAINPVNAMTHFMRYAAYTSPMDWPRLWEAFCVIWPPVMLLILGGRFLSFELELLGWAMWGLPYISSSMAGFPEGSWAWMSMGRFMAVMIPAHIIIGAVIVRFRWMGIPFLAASASAFGVFAYKFGVGEWVG